MSGGMIEKSWTWTLKAPREALWPLVSDTLRINEALRMPAYRLSETIDGDGLRRRHGQHEADGTVVRWEEPPFEWARGYWWRWQRFHEGGPIERTRATLVLEPGPRGGTSATYTLESEPRNAVGRMLVRTGHHRDAGKAFERLMRLADSHARKPVGDFFSNLAANRGAAARRGAAPYRVPEEVKGPDRDLARRMLDWMTVAFDGDLREVRAKRMARALGLGMAEAHAAAVVGTRIGALERHFRVICPVCHGTAADAPSPRAIPASLGCPRCGETVMPDAAASIEVVFTPHAAIRRPSPATHCASGPSVFPRTVLQQTLDPHERRDLPMRLLPGSYILRTVDGAARIVFRVEEAGGAVLRAGEGWIDGPGEDGAEDVVLENHGERPATFILARTDWPRESTSLAEWMTYQRARDSIDAADLDLGIAHRAGEASLVVASARGEDEAGACRRAALAHDGAVVEDTGAGTLMVFHRAASAVAAMEAVLDELPQARIGADSGPVSLVRGEGGGPSYAGEARDQAAERAGLAVEGTPNLSERFMEALR